jgi:methionine-rich copper-binding protein CopC
MRLMCRRVMTLAAVMTAALLGVAATAAPAFAHARVVSTSPGDGATVHGDVTRIVIHFDDVVTLVPHALTLTTDAGQPVAVESPRVVGGGRTLAAFVQDHLATGSYIVGWRIMADDGHIESSTFTFAVALASGAHAPAAATAPAAPPPAPGEPLWPVLVAVAIAVFAGAGAGLAVRRGLRLVAVAAAPYPEDHPGVQHAGSPRDDSMLRLPM